MEFWNDRRVLVTGGAGFVGSHVVERLALRHPASLIAPTRSDCDLRDVAAVRRLLQSERPNMVIHLAARVGGIGANRQRPGEFFYDNLLMGTHLLHESWQAGVDKFVGVGTVCSYPKSIPVPFSEDDFWQGYPEETNAPYGLAKKMLTVQSEAYRQQYGFNSIVLLPSNMYGPGDDFDPATSHVIPALIRRFIEAREQGVEQVPVWGTGSASREFLYVEEAVEAILLAAQLYEKSDPLNLGTGQEIPIRELVSLIARLVDFKGTIQWDPTKPDGQPRRSLDTSRARRELGFEARMPLEEGLKRTIDWYVERIS